MCKFASIHLFIIKIYNYNIHEAGQQKYGAPVLDIWNIYIL